jgi:hypothetical protein
MQESGWGYGDEPKEVEATEVIAVTETITVTTYREYGNQT